MRNLTIPAAFSLLAALLGGCGSLTPTAPPVNVAMVDLGGGASQLQLEEGRQIFTARCASCHAAYPVAKHSTIEWHRVVDQMADRTKLTADEKSDVLDYIAAANAVLTSR